MTTAVAWMAPVCALIGILVAAYLGNWVLKQDPGPDKMNSISIKIQQGAKAFLMSEYKLLVIFMLVVAVVMCIVPVLGPLMALAFITGGVLSAAAGYVGMHVATRANTRTAHAAEESVAKALNVSFKSGLTMGLCVASFALMGLSLWLLLLVFGIDLTQADLIHERIDIVEGFATGASAVALFARVGGGIYTKAADVGADLVGKVEAGIPEDDPRNPATIADNVGDNVGDVAGMGADLYESYCGSILSTAALGAALPMGGIKMVIAPMVVAAIGILLSILGIFAVRTREDADTKSLLRSLLTGTLGSSVLILFALLVLVKFDFISMGIFGSVLSGLAAGILIGQFTEYYTSDAYKPTRGIAGQAKLGAATTIIDGISVGMFSTGLPVVTIVIGIVAAFGCAGGFSDMAVGLYGVGFAAVGMLSTLGITLATDAFGPIADNAGGNAEMAGLDPEVRARTDELDMLGNTTAATGKGFAIGSAALTAMALLASYIEEVKIWLGHLAASAEGVWKVGSVAFANGANDLMTALSGVAGVKFLDGGTRAIAENGDLVGMVANKVNYVDFMHIYNLNLMNPMLLGGLFIGAMMTFVFCALTIKAVGRAASAMVEEVRRQFREIPGIMEGTGEPDYAQCVEISTTGAQHEMVIPSVLAVVVPVLVGLTMGVAGVFGLLAGGLACGFALATMLNNAGGAWDNAKKFVEKGNYGGKGSDTHKSAVVGDTVGDPFKDTAGPSLNILIKLMTMVSVVFAGVIVRFGNMLF